MIESSLVSPVNLEYNCVLGPVQPGKARKLPKVAWLDRVEEDNVILVQLSAAFVNLLVYFRLILP